MSEDGVHRFKQHSNHSKSPFKFGQQLKSFHSVKYKWIGWGEVFGRGCGLAFSPYKKLGEGGGILMGVG